MAAKYSPVNGAQLTTQVDEEGLTTKGGRGGWITFPFITVGILGLTLAVGGWQSNLIVYLIEEFNVKGIDAAQIWNVVNGSSNFIPVAAAIIADSFTGKLLVISLSSVVSLVGMVLITLTAKLSSLRPSPCTSGSNACEAPSWFQYGFLYTSITLLCIGMGGTRYTIATMGADQFVKPKHQDSFFNWYFICVYGASIIGLTALVYIEDNISWGWGFGIALGANAIGLVGILLGKKYYRHVKVQGSPFTSLARVMVATVRKRKVPLEGSDSKDFYFGHSSEAKSLSNSTPSSSFRFLNRAAFKAQGDTNLDGSVARPWTLCTVQQVEDLKRLIKILPLWSTSIFLSIPLAIQSSLIVLQARTMDRHMSPHFEVPASTFIVFNLLSDAVTLFITDRFLFPAWQGLARRPLSPLQRIGIGHILNIVGMAGSAVVEARRLHVARSHQLTDQPNAIVPMSAMWLVAPLAIVGVGEAFHFPGQIGLYYQEFPVSLRSTSTAMISLIIAIGFYLSTAMINLVQNVTSWLPDNINRGRIDNMFWLLVVIGVINFGYYLTCAMLYKYRHVKQLETSLSSTNSELDTIS